MNGPAPSLVSAWWAPVASLVSGGRQGMRSRDELRGKRVELRFQHVEAPFDAPACSAGSRTMSVNAAWPCERTEATHTTDCSHDNDNQIIIMFLSILYYEYYYCLASELVQPTVPHTNTFVTHSLCLSQGPSDSVRWAKLCAQHCGAEDGGR